MDELEFYDEDMVIDADFDTDFDEEFDEEFDEDFDEEGDYDEAETIEAMYGFGEDYDEDSPEEYGEWFGRKRRARKRRAAKKRAEAAKKRARSNVVTAKRVKANQSALAIAKRNIRRNAIGIKQVNTRVAGVSSRVSATARVNRIQSVQLRKMARTQRAVGILEFVKAYDAANNKLDLFQLLKGAVASGLIGTGKGGFDNPYLLGAAGFFLNANDGNLGGLLGNKDD